jgi:aminoglycoside phosphotransferase (APT) family kinase protein
VQHWEAEAVVDERLARDLVREHFPALVADSVELVSSGWDYTIHRVDAEWAFRFPRRTVVLEPMQRELAVLPVLGERLPVPLPVPVHVAGPSAGFPWPFYGARWLDGAEIGGTENRSRLARALAGILRRLHAPDVLDSLAYLPVDVVHRADMGVRVGRTRAELEAAAADGIWDPPPAVHDLLRRAERLPPFEPSAVCHGDLHFRQVLADDSGVTGIVDWVDVCRADPGIDLQLAFAFFGPEDRVEFFDEYGPVAESSLVRARVVALSLSASLARYGRATGARELEREAVASLDRAVL